MNEIGYPVPSVEPHVRDIVIDPTDRNVLYAAFQVGYESATQFSREYRRMFGAPPMRHIKAIQQLDAAERGAGDISYVAPYVAVLDGLGIMGEGSHAPGETADLDSLAPAAQAHGAAALSPVAAELTPPMTECVC